MGVRRVDTSALRSAVGAWAARGRTIGLVPTMGALHAGHTSLIRRCRDEGHVTVVSVFVNPTQFGPNEDFERYPRHEAEDVEIAMKAGADLVWFPSVPDLYPPVGGADPSARVSVKDVMHVDPGPRGRELCGTSRHDFFAGVCTVVLKLFQLCRPNAAYFGEKDWQQLVLIQQLVRTFHVPVAVHGVPLVREPDGLAMSSRNRYLQPTQRHDALALHRTIERARRLFADGERSADALCAQLTSEFTAGASAELSLDYLELREPYSLQPATELHDDTRILLAAWLGEPPVRLIDNSALGSD